MHSELKKLYKAVLVWQIPIVSYVRPDSPKSRSASFMILLADGGLIRLWPVGHHV